ncbi:MAG: RNA 2',3'-cyclic phosphodiesterase [Chloroflexi bacterium]|jgi:2'-5' RNA ligase|nr:RNA 2',3'-cyclic phosphodiesterase [Chloroflexota bacterium]
MAEMLRLFVAITLPSAILESLAAIQQRLSADTPHGVVRWVDPRGIHLTLKFLGDAPAAQQPELERALDHAAGEQQPFELVLSELGCFPSERRPRVVWVGLAGALPELHALRDDVERTITPLGYPTEDRPFSPHLTLGRVRREASASQASLLGGQVVRSKQMETRAWRVSSVSLMQSELSPGGATYTELHRVRFRRAASDSA